MMNLAATAIVGVEGYAGIIGCAICFAVILDSAFRYGADGLVGGIELRTINGIGTGITEATGSDIGDCPLSACFADANGAVGLISGELILCAMNGGAGGGDSGVGGGFGTQGDIAIIFSHCFWTDGDTVFARGLAVVVGGIAVEILDAFGIDCAKRIADIISRAGCPIRIISFITRGTDFS